MKTYNLLLFAAIFSLLFLSGCGSSSDSGFNSELSEQEKNCQVLTQAVNFGDVAIGSSTRETASIQCMDLTTLTITAVSATGSFSIGDGSKTVQTTTLGEAVLIDAFFAPSVKGSVNGAIRFQEANGDVYDVYLSGTGIGNGNILLPEITLSNDTFSNGDRATIALSGGAADIKNLSISVGTDAETSKKLWEVFYPIDISLEFVYYDGMLMLGMSGYTRIDKNLNYSIFVKACDIATNCETKSFPIIFN